MKAVYVGSVRGYQSPVYRPGCGWSVSGADRRTGRGPSVFAHRRFAGLGPLVVSDRRRTGFKTKVAIVAVLVTILALMMIFFGGALHL
jgi:hypothetical protein